MISSILSIVIGGSILMLIVKVYRNWAIIMAMIPLYIGLILLWIYAAEVYYYVSYPFYWISDKVQWLWHLIF
ncbi:MAG: hypothetical protein GX116_03960 [Fibrobacter sp.]|nr:hypothetical protein [Fibrobacter sp.]